MKRHIKVVGGSHPGGKESVMKKTFLGPIILRFQRRTTMRQRLTFLLGVVLVLGGFGLWPAGAYDRSLCGWWPFEDGSGTVAVDASGKAVPGTLFGNPAWSKEGVHGGCLTFDGTDDYVFIDGKFKLFTEHWSPKVIGKINDLAKTQFAGLGFVGSERCPDVCPPTVLHNPEITDNDISNPHITEGTGTFTAGQDSHFKNLNFHRSPL